MLKRLLHIGRLNHIAIATRDLNGQLGVFKDLLGAEISERNVNFFITNHVNFFIINSGLLGTTGTWCLHHFC